MLEHSINLITENVQSNIFLITALLITSWFALKYFLTPKNLPPGPRGVPILGYAPFLGEKPHVTIANLTQEYGDVIRINLGFTHVIFLTSFNAVKEALVKQAEHYSARPIFMIPPEVRMFNGIVNSNGETWSEYRRFSLSTLRDLGFGKASLEPQIMEEIDYFVKDVKSLKGNATDISRHIRLSVTNVIFVLMTGRRFEYNNPKIHEILHLIEEHMIRMKIGQIIDFIPFVLQKEWLLNLFGIKSPLSTGLKLIKFMSEVIQDHKKSIEVENVDNFINAWLNEQEKHGSNTKIFCEKNLTGILLDVFLAGSDTTATTLQWSLLYMIKYPEIQTKVQQEIDEVIGRERTPTMSDQKLMPYTEATIMEIQRITTIAPLALIHCTTKETSLFGYFIPKDSVVVPNLWAVHHDADKFSQPNDFNPDRFLTDDRQLKKEEAYIPFSMGKRQCMGESLARMELFLYFTKMLQNFTFKLNDGVEVDLNYLFALVCSPRPQPICAISR